jgi:SAM-dependent MidA family methyltransferase
MISELQVSSFSLQVSRTPLLQVIHQEISEAGGVLPFRRFMELALYHPEYGYYGSGRARVGKEGDFFTSVSVGSIYGRLLASVCCDVWERLGKPSVFTIVEQGANDGSMAADILGSLKNDDEAFYKAVRFMIVEPFPVNRDIQKQKLAGFTNVTWVPSLEELPTFTGIHLSNELLDAFPVDSVRWNGSTWDEECVACHDGALVWTTRPIQDPELQTAATNLPAYLTKGFRAEINRAMNPWLTTLHKRLERGVVLTVD